MVGIDPTNKKYIITFKRKDERPNQRDDKFEIFRNTIGLEDVRDILDLSRHKENHMHDPIRKTNKTVTDINSYQSPLIIARLTADQAARLRRDPNVLFIQEDAVEYADAETTGYQVVKLKAGTAWLSPLSATGSGVNVAIIDTGVSPHIDFGSPTHVKVNQNFTLRPGTASEDAPNYHGTHVAGICGAAASNNEGIQGIAPQCNIWNLRAGDETGSFQATDSTEAVQYALQNGAHVINMSFAGTTDIPARADLLQQCFQGGMCLCSSAGNTGVRETARYPSATPGVMAISNLSEVGDLPTPSSSFGPYVDFTAPGENINSLGTNNTYHTLTGTSMSSPAFAGVCALCLSAYNDTGCPPYDPGATKSQVVEKVIRETCSKSNLTGSTPAGTKDEFYGYGFPQANNAVASLKGVLA